MSIFVSMHFIMYSQNLITNGGFEDAAETYTVSESSSSVLKRVANIFDATNELTYPTAQSGAVVAGQWVKKAVLIGDDDAKAIVTNTDKKSGNNALNLKVGVLATDGYDRYTNFLFSQKLTTSLDNTKKYVVSFWAKPDGTANNSCTTVTVQLVDNTLKQTTFPLASTVELVSNDWTYYRVVLDIPKYKTFFATVDFTTAFIGFGINATYTNDSPAFTNYSGVLIDDIHMAEYTQPENKYVRLGGTGDGSSWQNASGDLAKTISEITRGNVYVAGGHYMINSTIPMKDSVYIFGAYSNTGVRELASNKTILDANNERRVVIGSDQNAPFYYGSKLDGFILQRGNSSYGSAARISLGCVLENCVIRNNVGNGVVGAAIYMSRNYRVPAAGSNRNYQATGGLINCVIVNNTSSGQAGAISGGESSLLSIVNCVIAKNECTEPTVGTGGLYMGKSAHWMHIQNTIFYRNSGATTALNNIRNNTTGLAFAILNTWFDNPTMPIVFTSDTRSICKENLTNSTVSDPDFVRPTSFVGATNEPQLIAELNASDWSLKSTSELIGRGDANQGIRYPYENMNQNNVMTPIRPYNTILTDIAGKNRVVNGFVDLGAYEYDPNSSARTNYITNKNIAILRNGEIQMLAKGNLQIISVTGSIVFSKYVDGDKVNISTPGVYILKLVDNNIVYTQKLIIN